MQGICFLILLILRVSIPIAYTYCLAKTLDVTFWTLFWSQLKLGVMFFLVSILLGVSFSALFATLEIKNTKKSNNPFSRK